MRKRFLALLTGALVLVLSAGVGLSVAGTTARDRSRQLRRDGQSLAPAGREAAGAQQVALREGRQGRDPEGHKVGKVAKGQYVELAREGEDSIFTVLGEFGNTRSTRRRRHAGPAAQPDPAARPGRRQHDDLGARLQPGLLREPAVRRRAGAISMRNFYIEQSSNRYTVNGEVTDWVKVPFNEASYGTNFCGSIVCSTVLAVRPRLGERLVQRRRSQPARRRPDQRLPGEVRRLGSLRLRRRRQLQRAGRLHRPLPVDPRRRGRGDRRRRPGRGRDLEPPLVRLLHATSAPDAVPARNRLRRRPDRQPNYWIGDYTIEPENGGVGVFSHEFGHDLGLPDLYDTSGNTGGAENSTGFWTLMSSGLLRQRRQPADGHRRPSRST